MQLAIWEAVITLEEKLTNYNVNTQRDRVGNGVGYIFSRLFMK